MRPCVSLPLKNDEFDLDATLGCGQCFRWTRQEDGSWSGVAMGRALTVRRRGGEILFSATRQEFETLWMPYFDLSRDYGALRRRFSLDPVLREAVSFAPGLRLLRQEPWEALCSFILSQNNNIPRIRGIVERLCRQFGERLPGGESAFPGPEKLAGLLEEDLAPLRCGFRARYVLDAARRVHSGEIDLGSLRLLPLDEARSLLMRITGVGPKVAECALLYGCGRAECFPVDVWIRRALAELYPGGLPDVCGAEAGIAQQYLFHFARCCPACSLNKRKEA